MRLLLKPIYLIIGTVLMLSSCSQSDEPFCIDADSRQILFRTSIPGVTTRAEVVTKDNLPYFYVAAFDLEDRTLMDTNHMYPLYANERISLVSNKDIYTSPFCCWPDQTKESHTISFFGFYPGLSEVDGARLVNASTPGTIDYKLSGFRIAEDIAEQLDFITAYSTGTMADNLFKGVTLPFSHQLSRIEIMAYGAHKSCDIEIAGVRIGGAGVKNTFEFKPFESAGNWIGEPERGIVEYVYRKGDRIVSFGKNNPVDINDAFSIMGAKHKGEYENESYENCAMLIPSTYAPWNFAGDPNNEKKQLYISVLLRITDATPTAGEKPVDIQRYPYKDLSQGADALEIDVVYLAVDKDSGEVTTRLYKNDSGYFEDSDCTQPYSLEPYEEVKEFGWAALPVEAEWLPGNIYTYKLDYTLGVGLLDPEVTTASPRAGDPVISDKVGITYTVKEWKVGQGDQFIVPEH